MSKLKDALRHLGYWISDNRRALLIHGLPPVLAFAAGAWLF